MVHKLGRYMMKNKSLEYINQLIKDYNLDCCKIQIIEAIEIIIKSFKNKGKLLCCGNGGSAADCEHIVGELMKGFVLPRNLSEELVNEIGDLELSNSLQYGLPAISLVSHTALSTAFSNDQLPSAVFAQQVLGYGNKEDVLLCISTSGNSLNCVYAAKVARALNIKVIALTGEKDSKLKELSDVTIQAPSKDTYRIQEYHLPIYHTMCLVIENEFFGN